MLPVILSITPRGDGTAVAVVSVSPGRRVQLLVIVNGVDDDQLRATISALAQLTERKGTP